jgi:hypothetical protein
LVDLHVLVESPFGGSTAYVGLEFLDEALKELFIVTGKSPVKEKKKNLGGFGCSTSLRWKVGCLGGGALRRAEEALTWWLVWLTTVQ